MEIAQERFSLADRKLVDVVGNKLVAPDVRRVPVIETGEMPVLRSPNQIHIVEAARPLVVHLQKGAARKMLVDLKLKLSKILFSAASRGVDRGPGLQGPLVLNSHVGRLSDGDVDITEKPLQMMSLASDIGNAAHPALTELALHRQIPLLNDRVLEVVLHRINGRMRSGAADLLKRGGKRICKSDVW